MARDDERGFTLVELLIVILIIGLLAAVGLVEFTGQARKGFDAQAKDAVGTAQTAVETYRIDHGDFCNVTAADLQTIEPSLPSAPTLAVSGCAGGDKQAYSVSVESKSTTATTYTLTYNDGTSARTCTPTGDGCVDGSW